MHSHELRRPTAMGVVAMGRYTDPEHPGAKRHYDEEYARFFWPKFPADFVMLEVPAHWLEFMGPGVSNHRQHWRPQAVTFSP